MSCKNCYHDNLLGRWGFSGLTVSSFTLEVWRPQSLYAWNDRGESRQRNKTGRERKVGGGVHEKVKQVDELYTHLLPVIPVQLVQHFLIGERLVRSFVLPRVHWRDQ